MKSRFLILLILIGWATISRADNTIQHRHIDVAMRMIGDQILLLAGDSTSRVLPIERQGNRFKIEFDNTFQLTPAYLSKAIDSVLLKNKISDHYLVEVVNPETDLIVYNYKVGNFIDATLRPCGQREYPVGQYQILITLLNAEALIAETREMATTSQQKDGSSNHLLLILPLLISVGLFSYWRKKPLNESKNDTQIVLGKYHFDKPNLSLTYEQHTTALTYKEAALLDLLYSRINTVVERDEILHIVWGDEGDYVGRTLDVFISKLRKKLAQDPQLKIANVRGVGYKLTLLS